MSNLLKLFIVHNYFLFVNMTKRKRVINNALNTEKGKVNKKAEKVISIITRTIPLGPHGRRIFMSDQTTLSKALP